MTSYALDNRHQANAFFGGTSSAGTADADIRAILEAILRKHRERASDWRNSIEPAIAEILEECSIENWDGYGAAPISGQTLYKARDVALLLRRFLPSAIPAPDLIPEGDGNVSLNWTRDKQRGISICIGPDNTINFAGILAKGIERHGCEIFDKRDSRGLEEIAQAIRRLYEQ